MIKYKRLTIFKLKKLPTKRLLTMLKIVRKTMARYGWQIGIEGDDSFQSAYNFYVKYYDDIKSIAKDRPHIETKLRKIRGCPIENKQKRNKNKNADM